ncbi:MAG: hypothetical protein KIS81_00295 [Maricaulaceae bacterium]|nr:hypothetical protein [Maricaulaceae bacterium]
MDYRVKALVPMLMLYGGLMGMLLAIIIVPPTVRVISDPTVDWSYLGEALRRPLAWGSLLIFSVLFAAATAILVLSVKRKR